MTAYTSSGTGDWNVAATWGGAGVPTTGDTATISAGHEVTIPSGYTATCGAVTLNAGATKLIVEGTYDLGGTLTLNSGTTLAGNGAFVIDLNGNTIAAAAACFYTLLGTSGNRGTVQSTGSAGTVTGGAYAVISTLEYVDFDGLGAANLGRTHTNATGFQSWRYCTFTNCAHIDMDATGVGANAGFLLEYCDFITPSTADPEVSGHMQPNIYQTQVKGSQQRTIRGCTWTSNGTANSVMTIRAQGTIAEFNVFDDVKIYSYYNNIIYRNNFFKTAFDTDNEFFKSSGGLTYIGFLIGNYFYYDKGDHPLGYTPSNGPVVSYGNVMDNEDGGAAANWHLWTNTGALTHKIRNNLMLGVGIMATTTQSGAPTLFDQSRNTVYGSNDGQVSGSIAFAPLFITEQTATMTGTIRIRSNLVMNPDTDNNTWDVLVDLLNNTADQVDACGYNYAWGYTAGAHTPTYGANVATPTPGTGDGSVDPQLVERGRNLKTWCNARGYGAATVSAAVAALKADTSRIDDLVNYCFEGFKPANATLRTAAHDGGQVGAAIHHKAASTTNISTLRAAALTNFGVTV